MKLKLTKEERIVFIISILGFILARGITFFTLGYAVDDYIFTLFTPNIGTVLYQGRWGSGLFFEFFNYLGIQGVFSPTLLMFIAAIGFVLLGIIICRIWKINNNITLSSLVVLFITLFPYQAEIFTFKMTLTFFIFSLFFGFTSVYLSKFKLKEFSLATILFVFAISMYQLVINYVFVAIITSLVIETLRSYKSDSYKYDNNFWFDVIRRINLGPQLLTLISGTSVYFLMNKLLLSFLHISIADRGNFINLHNISNRLYQFKISVETVFFQNEPILPLGSKILLLVLLFFVCVGLIRLYYLRRKNTINSFKVIMAVLILLAVSILGVWGVSLLLAVWWPVPRIIASLGVFWAGILVVGYTLFDESVKKIFFIISTILIFSFIGINNHVYIDQLRINMKDIQMANRIIVRLQMLPNFTKIKTIAFVGTRWGYGTQIKTLQGDMNISAFGAEWSRLNLINEVGGFDFSAASNNEVNIAKDLCGNESISPNSDFFVGVTGTLGVICLQ